MQYSRVLDSLHENTFKKTISIQWKRKFLCATFGTAVFPCLIPLPPSNLYFLSSHSTRDWCRPQPPILLKNTMSRAKKIFSRATFGTRAVGSLALLEELGYVGVICARLCSSLGTLHDTIERSVRR
jgi:hypothetical protein